MPLLRWSIRLQKYEVLEGLVKSPTNCQGRTDRSAKTEILSFEEMKKLSITQMAIFYRMMDSYLCRCVIKWVNVIQDKETLKELLQICMRKLQLC